MHHVHSRGLSFADALRLAVLKLFAVIACGSENVSQNTILGYFMNYHTTVFPAFCSVRAEDCASSLSLGESEGKKRRRTERYKDREM